MASSSVLVYCPCLSPLSVTRPPPSQPPLSSLRHHELSSLLFCEECDAIRCDACAQQEIACYFCPSCLFEVPSASVRAEKNRCARNCFQCPQCDHSLNVVASDPSPGQSAEGSASTAFGELPFYLTCTVCHWDSKEVQVSFEKPTGLALQLQKQEQAISAPSARDSAEFDRLKDHFEAFLRQTNPATTSTSAALRDAPLLSARALLAGSTTLGKSRLEREREASAALSRDELAVYKAMYPASRLESPSDSMDGLAHHDVKIMREMQDLDEVASLDKRWTSGWQQSIEASALRPLRTPLHTKRSKRCPACTHILIKPEQKSSSTRFKIKLVASNYLPAIDLLRRAPATIGSRLGTISAPARRAGPRSTGSPLSMEDSEPLRPGRTYTFELGFVNPLYEPIHVRLAVARPRTATKPAEGSAPETPPYAVNLPTAYFPIAAYAEEWEYEMDDIDGEDELGDGHPTGEGTSRRSKLASKYGPGIVEREMNKTTVELEVAVARDAVGPLRANMLVTYYYQSDDSAAPPSPTKSPVKGGAEKEERKSFSFWTFFTLGTVIPRSERSETSSRRAAAQAST